MSYKILIIDDDPTLCLIADKKLTQLGYQVLIAQNGEQGIQCAIENSPDIFLLDYNLPDITGNEVCHKLRNLEESMDKPILFITGKDDFQSIENAFQVGATDFARKPLNWMIVSYRIQYMLRGHELYLSLLSSESRLTKAQRIAKIANWEYSPLDKSFNWSETTADILELDEQHLEKFEVTHFLNLIPENEKETVQFAIENCLNNHVGFDLEHELITPKGRNVVIHHLGNIVINDANGVIDCIGTLQDITERRNTENRIRTLAYFDSLTGLMNRESFLSALDKILISNKTNHLMSALFFIDLDDFKRVNDTLGHDCGDALLCEVAERLNKCVRTAEQEQDKELNKQNYREINSQVSDSVFRVSPSDINRFDLGRLGGDEFTVFLGDICDKEVASIVARRLLKSLEKPFDLEGHELYITFSVGIAVSPNDGDNVQTLLKNADTAMYYAKSSGKNNFQFYLPAMNDESLNRLAMESDLRHAIVDNELYLVYQPQINLQTGELIGAEALMRWKHKAKGLISPAVFIPLAEETGQIMGLGNWLFEQFSKDLQAWKKQGLIPEGFKLALNVSSLQFHQKNLMDKIGNVFFDLELNKHVEFELTESVLMNNAKSNLEKLNLLAEKNITLSIDDFGTGYSSLSYLHRFPVHALKIDRSFISNMENDGQTSIVRAIIAMAHGMDVKVVAEGIETQWQYDYLKLEGCDIGQGFFLYKPMNVDDFHQLLQSQ